MKAIVENAFSEHIEAAQRSKEALNTQITQACEMVIDCLKRGNKVLFFGNGGSASDAQHIAAEFVGRFVKNRKSLPAIALTTDTSAITAISNDYGYERVFARQVEGLAVEGDIVVGISTSGNSESILKGLEMGRQYGCKTIGLTGRDGGKMHSYCDIAIVVPSDATARIQEMHILIGHIICEAIDAEY
jgi:D-sedoheptulose 7-phosphate isomerase